MSERGHKCTSCGKGTMFVQATCVASPTARTQTLRCRACGHSSVGISFLLEPEPGVVLTRSAVARAIRTGEARPKFTYPAPPPAAQA